jgi:hypothetical protein
MSNIDPITALRLTALSACLAALFLVPQSSLAVERALAAITPRGDGLVDLLGLCALLAPAVYVVRKAGVFVNGWKAGLGNRGEAR